MVLLFMTNWLLFQISNFKLTQLYDYKNYNMIEHLNILNNIHSLISKTLIFYKGVSSKYINRYMALFVFLRRFMTMDDNEKLPIIKKALIFKFNITQNSLRTSYLFTY